LFNLPPITAIYIWSLDHILLQECWYPCINKMHSLIVRRELRWIFIATAYGSIKFLALTIVKVIVVVDLQAPYDCQSG
jgi:hypothetical protein